MRHITYISTYWHFIANTFNTLRPSETRNTLHDQFDGESACVQTMAWCQGNQPVKSLDKCMHHNKVYDRSQMKANSWMEDVCKKFYAQFFSLIYEYLINPSVSKQYLVGCNHSFQSVRAAVINKHFLLIPHQSLIVVNVATEYIVTVVKML